MSERNSLPVESWGNKLLIRAFEQVVIAQVREGLFHEPEWSHLLQIRAEILGRMVDDSGKLQEFPTETSDDRA